ncbi:hypothetical protein BFP77_05835 [Maribacter sp. 4U21]|nr:hypothetical protein BFP77_05835 [Maribacter sp. 4U21]
MGATIITTEDLREFKMELLDDIKQLLSNQSGHSSKKWLKSPEVRELLGISPGTLQNRHSTVTFMSVQLRCKKRT